MESAEMPGVDRGLHTDSEGPVKLDEELDKIKIIRLDSESQVKMDEVLQDKNNLTHTDSGSPAELDVDEEVENKIQLEKRRSRYQCAYNFKTLDNIHTWAQFIFKDKTKIPGPESPDKLDLTSKISLWQGDITTLEIDAIVNAANYSLLGGGGVDGAIHRAAGRELRDACIKLNGCETGDAKITKGFKLPSKFIIHTVGPVGRKDEKLKQCYQKSLQLVLQNKLRSVAFPCISTGVYGFPREPAANIALKTVKDFLGKHHSDVDRVIFCVFLHEDVDIYKKLIPKYFQ